MKVLLMCANGLSTGMLMTKMKQWAAKTGADLEIKAIPVDDCDRLYKNYDVLLLGPQMSYRLDDVKKMAPDRPSAVIAPADYGMGNVENIMKMINGMLGGEHT